MFLTVEHHSPMAEFSPQQPDPHWDLSRETSLSSISTLVASCWIVIVAGQPHATFGMLMRWVNVTWTRRTVLDLQKSLAFNWIEWKGVWCICRYAGECTAIRNILSMLDGYSETYSCLMSYLSSLRPYGPVYQLLISCGLAVSSPQRIEGVDGEWVTACTTEVFKGLVCK